jgi:MATE family multidrug resistance protein
LVAFFAASAIITLQIPIQKTAFYLLNGSAEVEQLASSYFYIRIWAAPATIGIYAVTGWFIGMQNTKIPMVIAIISNIVNMGLNMFFVFVMKMNSDGVAWGTVIAQYTGFAISLFFVWRYYRKLFKYADKKSIFNTVSVKNFFNVNRNIFIRTISLLAVFTFFTSKSASVNDDILAANSILLQFLFIFSFLTDGFAYAAEALTGKFYGAGQYQKLHQTIKLIFIWGGTISLIFTCLYYFGNRQLLMLLTNQQHVLEVASKYTIWVVLIPVMSVSSFIWDGVFIGITAAKQMRNSMLISTFAVFFPVWYFFNDKLHNHALWLAFILFMLSRGLIQTIMYKYVISKKLY